MRITALAHIHTHSRRHIAVPALLQCSAAQKAVASAWMQVKKCADAGADVVRIAVQGRHLNTALSKTKHITFTAWLALVERLQVKKCADAGADIVRITVQGRKEAESICIVLLLCTYGCRYVEVCSAACPGVHCAHHRAGQTLSPQH
jgi:4-hydroxy-3-methylbut-2-en-1-yl diphosphate synthase IspG/GcpE